MVQLPDTSPPTPELVEAQNLIMRADLIIAGLLAEVEGGERVEQAHADLDSWIDMNREHINRACCRLEDKK